MQPFKLNGNMAVCNGELYGFRPIKKELSKVDDNMSKTEIIIRKNRSGRIGTAEVLFKKNTTSFLNYKNDTKE